MATVSALAHPVFASRGRIERFAALHDYLAMTKPEVNLLVAITTAAALLALIIGGLSVVNTMFMAVAERVREIGLKKAVGATTLDIMGEFLFEATLIGVVGGLIGYGLGAGITVILNATTPPGQSTLFLVTPSLTILAIGFATVLGALAGILPAWRAARLDPVTALRNE